VAALVFTVVFLSQSPSATYDDATRNEFIAGCVTGSQNEAYCSCTFERLQDRLNASDFDALDQRMREGLTTSLDIELLNDISSTCAAENNSF